MNKAFLLVLSSIIPLLISSESKTPQILNKRITPINILPSQNSTPHLINALIHVESRGKSDAIGDVHLKTPSIGVLQIRPIMVREVNRILKKRGKNKHFILEDRFSKSKSIEMFKIWKGYHHKNSSDEVISRCWNGGSLGYKNKSTLQYWGKVKDKLEQLNGKIRIITF